MERKAVRGSSPGCRLLSTIAPFVRGGLRVGRCRGAAWMLWRVTVHCESALPQSDELPVRAAEWVAGVESVAPAALPPGCVLSFARGALVCTCSSLLLRLVERPDFHHSTVLGRCEVPQLLAAVPLMNWMRHWHALRLPVRHSFAEWRRSNGEGMKVLLVAPGGPHRGDGCNRKASLH